MRVAGGGIWEILSELDALRVLMLLGGQDRGLSTGVSLAKVAV